MRRFIVGTLMVLFAAGSVPAQDLGAEDVMRRLRQKFEDAGAWQARFRQALDAEFAGATSVIEGSIVLSDSMYRIETVDQTVVTDGDTTWVYLVDENQVIINDYVEDDESFTPAHFLDERAERYDVAFAEEQEPGYHVVELRATSPDTYIESATLWIDNDTYTVSQINVVDVNGDSIRFEMSDLTLLTAVPDSTFTFVPDEGVEIIDLR